MEIIETNIPTEHQKLDIMRLWNREYPRRLALHAVEDFDKYLEPLQRQKHYIAQENGEVVAWAFQFWREGEPWFALIVQSDRQGQGIGHTMLQMLKANHVKLCGWVIDQDNEPKANGEYYRSPLVFYLKNGFSFLPAQRLETEKMSAVKIMWEVPSVSPKEILNRWIGLFNAADAHGIAELYADDAVNHQVANEPVEGKVAIRNMFLHEFAAAKMVCIPENIFEDGEWAILEWKDPKGLRGCGFFHVRYNKIIFQRGYWDKLSFDRLLEN